MKPLARSAFLLVAASAAMVCSLADAGAAHADPLADSQRWFQEARFGMFIHWGVYSLLGDGEWVQNNRKIRTDDYEKLPALFNPRQFDAKEWVSLAKAAGMKYITITSKHHDGFAMFDSKVSDWDIVDRTPYKKDPLKALADECRRQGLKIFFYYSQLDWHHPDYFPRGGTGKDTGRPEKGEWPKYIDYMNTQLTELLTHYGPVAGIWFDGMWDRREADWRLADTYGLIHRLQPGAMVGSNHHRKPFPGEDFQMFEKDLPGQNSAGFSGQSEVSSLPLETCDTINNSWGYHITDKQVKSTKALVGMVAGAAGRGANFLLNVGPMPNGMIQKEFVDRLGEMGRWLKANGESIYGTRKGPVPPRPWGVTTQKGKTVYVHVLDWADTALAMPALGGKPKRARALTTGATVDVREVDGGLLLKLPPAEARDPNDTVIAVEIE